jgi:hypothetical protein
MPGFELYVVTNADGEYFHRKGYGGHGSTWCKEPHKARIFTKIGQARARITYFAKNFPKYPAPTLRQILVASVVEVDGEAERVEKAKVAHERRAAREAKRLAERQLKHAQERLKSAMDDVSRLSAGVRA